MNNQQIDDLETRLWMAQSHLKQKHQPLEAQLKQLSEELKNTWRSSKKLEIMNHMSEIEQQIKNDRDSLKRIQEGIELLKSPLENVALL